MARTVYLFRGISVGMDDLESTLRSLPLHAAVRRLGPHKVELARGRQRVYVSFASVSRSGGLYFSIALRLNPLFWLLDWMLLRDLTALLCLQDIRSVSIDEFLAAEDPES